jgi:hypothetical protein
VAVKFIEKKFVDQEELKLLQREIDIMARVSLQIHSTFFKYEYLPLIRIGTAYKRSSPI